MRLYMLEVLAENPEAHRRFREKAVQYANSLTSVGGHTTYQTADGSVVTEPIVQYYIATEFPDEMDAVLAIAESTFEGQIAFPVLELGSPVVVPR